MGTDSLSLQPKEIIKYTVVVVTLTTGIIFWANKTFQSKEAAVKVENDLKDDQKRLERRMDIFETESKKMADSISTIKADTSYIRGRLEPRTK